MLNEPILKYLLQPHQPGVHFLKIIQKSITTCTYTKNTGKPPLLALKLFYTRLLFLLQLSVLSLSIVPLNKHSTPLRKQIFRQYSLSQIRSRLHGLPHLEKFTWQNFTHAERVIASGTRPHLSYKCHQIKMRHYVTGGLPHLSSLPHLPPLPHFHLNRP